MNITSLASAVSASNTSQASSAVQLNVLRKALDTQASGALALVQAVPTPPPAPVTATAPVTTTGPVGGNVNIFA
ncbi:MAG: putative motility protein [Candidatus Accumulibacter sp.]|jgi:hypothetical protein|nr:putative motility protein [Accumulibacter sp.]